MKHRFFIDFLIYGMASFLGKIVAVFLMPVYTNVLTKEEYGAMALITSVQGIIGMVSNLNIHSGIARDYYEKGIDRKQLVSTGFFSILFLSLTIMCIGLSSRFFWGIRVLGLKERYIPAFTVMLANIPAASLMSYFAILTRFQKKPVQYSLGTVIQLLIQIGVSVIGVVVLRAGIISVFLGFLTGELFALCYFAILNREYIRIKFSKNLLRRALVFALPTLPAILAGWLDSSMGQILIGRYVSVEDLGVYSIALSLASVFTLISMAFQNVWSPYLYENYQQPWFKRSIKNLFCIIALALVIISLLLSIFSNEIVLLLSNEGYLDACRYVTLLCIPMSFYLLFPFASSGVSITRDTKYVGIAYVAGSCCNLLMLFVLIRYLGVISVPLSLAASRSLSYLVLYRVSEKKVGLELPNYLLLVLVLFVLVGYFIISLHLIFWVRCIIAVLLVSILAIYVYKRFDIKSILTELSLSNS